MTEILTASSIPVPQKSGDDVEIMRRSDGTRTWLFAINHASTDAVVTVDGVDLLTGAATGGTLTVASGGVAVVRETAA